MILVISQVWASTFWINLWSSLFFRYLEQFQNNGCEGGLPDNAFNYIRSNGGIDTEISYPYEAQDGSCRYKVNMKGGYDNGFMDIKTGDEQQLKIAVATIGPVSTKYCKYILLGHFLHLNNSPF